MISLGACTKSCDRVDAVLIFPQYPVCMAVNDSATFYAEARNNTFMSGVLYESQTEPARFRWSTSDPAVATVNFGLVRAHQAGVATIDASAEGITGHRPLEVELMVAQIIVTVAPDPVHVGDTVVVTVTAADSLGLPLDNAHVVSWPADAKVSMVTWPEDMPVTPYTYRIRADSAGTAVIRSNWSCLSAEPPLERLMTYTILP
jgi:hypothetical protein